jgi:DNA helicase-2/ATP-dependent DNA helicase PcrA
LADWAAIRRLARERRWALVPAFAGMTGRWEEDALNAQRPTPNADSLLDAAIAQEGLWSLPTAPDDPALAGAYALLDRITLGILYDGDLPPEKRRFALTHELAHWWLHDESPPCVPEDLADAPMAEPPPYGRDYVSGYSPAEKREVEANVFAAEFLLPAPVLRAAFLAGQTASGIAASAGLSETAVLAQMAEALLIGSLGDGVVGSLGSAQSPNHPTTQRPNDLDESQREAAEVESGPVLITAGPGTGKTRTLVARALVLLERGVAPENILALTFSNKAANEMRERLAAVVPDAARRLWIGTFHAFGLELLRRYGTRLGLPPAPALLDPVDAVALLERHLTRLDLREFEYLHNPTWPFPHILQAISRAKDELVMPEQHAELAAAMEAQAGEDEKAQREAAKAREVARVHRVWQQILQEEGKLDFGDLIARAVELLQTFPDVREEVQRQYPHVLVDEYQDINRASAIMVKLVAGEGRGFWAVGDLQQSIYGFRGASPVNLVRFEEDYPDGRRMTLRHNYRSRQPLVALFGAAAGRMAGGRHEGWRANRPAGDDAIIVAAAEDEEAQADGIANAIRRFEERGVPLSGQAILCATNAQAERMAGAMEARGIPVLYLGDLFARPEVRDMLSLLSLAGEGRGQGLYRVAARFEEYGIPPEDALAAIRWAQENGRPFPQALTECGIPSLAKLHTHLDPIAFRGDAFLLLARYIFGPAGYLRRLLRRNDVPARQSRIALYQLLLLARAHAVRLGPEEAENPHRAFLNHVRHLIATQEDNRARLPAAAQEIEAVRLMTVHGAKGLEFPVVFLPNLAKDMFPSRRRGAIVKPPAGLVSDTGMEEAEEAQRLFFVALSRARDHLILSRPLSVGGKPRDPSPLFALIDGSLDACGAQRVRWLGSRESRVASRESSPCDSRLTTHDSTELPVRAVEQYMRCPRQYYYERVLSLPGAEEESAYSRFQECVWATIHRVRQERAAGRTVTPADVTQWLEERWQEAGPGDHPHAPILRARAMEIVGRFCTFATASGEERRETAEAVAQLPGGRVKVRLDAVAETPDGALLVERYDTGRPSEDDHRDPRLAMMRESAKQERAQGRPVRVVIRYLSTGDEKEVPEKPRYEQPRVEKYDEALRGIRAGDFPARPSEENCPRCPFFFICPA